MGITISTSKRSFDIGYGGFMRFRQDLAKQVGYHFGRHYLDLEKAPGWNPERVKFFEKYDKKTKHLIENKMCSEEIANFCYQSDCEGTIDKKQAKMIYDLIKDCDDNIIYGYTGRNDCTTMEDMKLLFKDCYSHSKQVVWW